MKQSDIELTRRLNRMQLDQNYAHAKARYNPALIAISAMVSGAATFGILLLFFEWVGV